MLGTWGQNGVHAEEGGNVVTSEAQQPVSW